MAGGEHHAEVGAERAGEVGDARGGEHTEQEDVDPGRGEPGHDGGLEELPGDPRVASDHGDRAVALERAGLAEHVCRGDGEVQGELRGDVAVGEAPDPVRAEETTHGGQVAARQRLEY